MASIESILAGLLGGAENVPEGKLAELKSLIEGSGAPKKRGRKSKKAKDPSAPKRPASSYMMWLKENRQKIIDEHFADYEFQGREKVSLVGQKAGELWKGMSEEEKSPWVERYASARAEYMSDRPAAAPKVSFKFDVASDSGDFAAPEGYEGPFKVQYLSGLANGRVRGTGTFDNFEDAIAAANELGDKCGGVTKDTYGWSLRLGGELKQDLNKPHMVTYRKLDFEGPTRAKLISERARSRSRSRSPKRSDGEMSPEPTKRGRGRPRKSVSPKPDSDSEEDVNTTVIKATVSRKPVAKTPAAAAAKILPASYDSESDSEDEEEISVDPWVFKGTTYLLDESTGIVYDYDTSEEIGTRNKEGELVLA